MSSFRSHQIGNKNYGVFPIVQRKHFPWDIRQKGIHCGCKPGLAERNSLNIFFPGQKHTTYYYYSTRKLFFQINTGAQRSSIVVTFIGGLYYRKCPNTNKAAMFVLTTLPFVCKLGKKVWINFRGGFRKSNKKNWENFFLHII